MKKLILICLLLLVTVCANGQTFRFGGVILKDSAAGMIVKHKDTFDAGQATIYVASLRLKYGTLLSDEGISIESVNVNLQSSNFPSQSIYINNDGSNDYNVNEGSEHRFNIQFDEKLAINRDSVTIVPDLYVDGMIKSDTGWYEWHHNVLKIRDGNVFTIVENEDLYGLDMSAGVREGSIFYLYFTGSGNVISEGSSSYVDFLLPGGTFAYSPGDMIGFVYLDGYARQISISDY